MRRSGRTTPGPGDDQHLRTALTQLAGGLSQNFNELRDQLLDLLAELEAGLDFVAIQREDYELCYSEELRADPVLASLRKTMQQASLKCLFQDLPGYDVRNMGEERSVARAT